MMYDVDKLKKILINRGYKIIDNRGKILPPSNPIYGYISKNMDGKLSAKHIYVIAKNNRNGIHDYILNYYGLNSTESQNDLNSFQPNMTMSKYFDKFYLKLSKRDWKAIRPRYITYKDDRTYITLQSGWTDILAKNIWIQFRIPCSWVFKTAKSSRQKLYYCRITAKCSECCAKLICTLVDEPGQNEDDIVFECIIKNPVPDYVHIKRKQLRGHTRVTNTLMDTKTDAMTYIQNQTKDLINFGDSYSPISSKTNVLRKTIAEAKDKRSGLVGTKSINNIINIKDTTHVGSVHKIGASPFFCHYWTKEQKLLYKLH